MPHFRAAGAVCSARVCLADELVPGFLDRFAQRAVTGQRVAGNVIPVAAMERVGGPAELIGVIESVGYTAEPAAPPSPDRPLGADPRTPAPGRCTGPPGTGWPAGTWRPEPGDRSGT